MNEAEDGGAESLASKFEIQRHQFLYRVDTCRSAAERLSSSGCSHRRRRSTGAALPQARPGTAAPKQRHYSPSHLQAPSRHAAASTHSPLTGSSRAEEAIGRGGRRRGGAARMQLRAVRSTDARAAAALPRRPPLRLWWRGDSRLAWTSFRRHDSLPPTTTGARLLRHALIIYYFARTSRVQCCADHIIYYHKLNHYVGSSNLPARSGLVYSGLGQQG